MPKHEYFNTTQLPHEQATLFELKNMSQNERVLAVIKSLKTQTFSASLIYKNYPVASVPITSIRRAINTLKTKYQAITETGHTTTGMYGAPEKLYKLNKNTTPCNI